MLAQKYQSGGQDHYVSFVTISSVQERCQAFFTREKYKELRALSTVNENHKAIEEMANFIQMYPLGNRLTTMGVFTFATLSNPSFVPTEQFSEEQGYGAISVGHLDFHADSKEWIPLDGMNRILAIYIALSRLTGKQKTALGNEFIPVLLLPVSSFAECRELFIRFRKSAHSIKRGENIRTSVNDVNTKYVASLMGKDLQNTGVIPESLISQKSNTLTNRSIQFSTLSVLYDSSKILDQALDSLSSNSTVKDVDKRYEEIAAVWKQLFDQFTPFSQAIHGKPEDIPTLRSRDFCLKPTGQLVVISVLAKALEIQKDLSLEETIRRMNTLPWQTQDSLWQGVIVVDGRINGSVQAVKYTALFIAYLIGFPLSDIDFNALERWYQSTGKEKRKLPERRFPVMQM